MVRDNPAERRYELWLGDELAGWCEYARVGDVLVIPHVEVLPRHRGAGHAGALVDAAAAAAAARGERIVATCSFAAAHLAQRG